MKKVVKYLSLIICAFVISINYVRAASYDVTVTSNYNREFIIEDITNTEVIAYVGDPSGDDVWNVLDLNVIANAILEGADDVIYDLNEDGFVNVLDYNMVVNTLLAE